MQRTAIILVLMALLQGCGRNSGEQAENIKTITVFKAVRRDVGTVIDVSGNINPQNRVTIYPKVSGRVISLYGEEGKSVARDQVLAEVQQDLPGSEYLPSPVRSTVRGTVLRKMAEVGSSVTPQTPMFEVGDTRCLIFSGQVYGEERGQVKIGQRMILMGEGGDTLVGLEINKVGSQLDPLTGGLVIEAGLCLARKVLMPGQQVEGQVRVGSIEGILIPRLSLVKGQQGREGVFAIRDNRARFIPVEVLSRSEGHFIVKGLDEGVEVAAEGAAGLIQGQKVRIKTSS